ncbi:PilW family protein [Aquabacterium sp.]|uniref:PilW family protein n=1 Tax=Aquabacterium sp. TaxID=1872578 RepID=UPI0035AE1AC6
MRPNLNISARHVSRTARPEEPKRNPRQRGFTLIELMVGIVLGMVTVAIIAQVFAVSESKKRSTTTGADAQINGTLALYAIQREAQMAGYGFADYPASIGCNVRYKYSTNGDSTFPLVPVIIDAGVNGSNVLTLMRSGKSTYSLPVEIKSNHAQSDLHYSVQSTLGVSQGDLMVIVPGGEDAKVGVTDCSVVQVKDGTGSEVLTATNIPVTAGSGGLWNQQSILPALGYKAGAYMLNMGGLAFSQYSVNAATNSLQQSVMTAGTGGWTAPQDLYQQVVVFKAMYGKAATTSAPVSIYDNVEPTTPVGWSLVRSVRIMVVARSSQYEKDEVTLKPLLWDVGKTDTVAGTVACGSSKCIEVPVDFLPDWKHYRYKIYDTVVPLRNILWNS